MAATITSYAQNREDVILNRIFQDLKDGFYIDIGAYHPTVASVTKTFYDRGWSGVNVEPGPVFDELERARPRDVNLKAAVVDYDGEIGFLENSSNPGMSKVMPAEVHHDHNVSTEQISRVSAITLNSLVAKYAKDRTINFLKIDAEGAEMAIIRSTNWKVIRPQVMVIEATAPWSNELVNQEWEPKLLTNNYIRAFFDGINVFYLRDEDKELLSRFDMPLNVLDNYGIFDQGAQQLRIDQAELSARNTELTEKLTAAKARSDTLAASLDLSRDEVTRLRAMIADAQSDAQDAQRDLQRVAARAARYDRLVSSLRDPDGPRALRIVLPLARVVRKISHVIGSRPKVPMAPHDISKTSALLAGPRRLSPKRIALAIYRRFLGPVVRPSMGRIRLFMMQPVSDQVARVNDQVAGLRSLVETQQRTGEMASEHIKSLEALIITIASQTRK
ncbi:FkbM family methyltransferase [Rhizobium calliandrae]|uniref:FkbM family methyltransferase n=1 Tax=Rhizobium calliandrae TaxID=1312182 RepID=A0ABT7KQ75_9HYPH|nr:FkbM family methyltransferase [Rhizobium calliandrae]MDL2410791.1 FkbM family methyltransferase [Rhizobium calliandrae]